MAASTSSTTSIKGSTSSKGSKSSTSRESKEGQDEERRPTSCGKKFVIVGTVIIFVAAAGSIAVIYFDLWPVPTCRVIRQARAKEQDISKEFDVSVINDCERDFDCPFDISTCQIPCPLGFKMEENRCPISCECALTSRGTFQGDIQFDDTEAASLLKRYGHTSDEETFALFSSSVRQSIVLWPKAPDGRAKVPYFISEEFVSEINLIQEAFAVYSRETCVDFVQKTGERDYINFVKEVGCWSRVGRRVGPQKISLSDSCMSIGFLLHEMMHALGFDHEHVRPDRDGFITIDRDNIIPDQHMNFAKIREPVKNLGSPYDVYSVTHISSRAWITKPNVYSFVKAAGNPILGQTDMLSREDIREINSLYHCYDLKGQGVLWTPGELPRPKPPGDAGQGSDNPAQGGSGVFPAPGQPSTEAPDVAGSPIRNDGFLWSDWGPWSSCVETCGPSWSYRYRRCEDPDAPYVIGRFICEPGFWHDQTPCTEDPCLEVTGTWGEWLTWSSCTATCGSGYRSRQRVCQLKDGPIFAHPPAGAERCKGYGFDSGPCPFRGLPCPTGGSDKT